MKPLAIDQDEPTDDNGRSSPSSQRLPPPPSHPIETSSVVTVLTISSNKKYKKLKRKVFKFMDSPASQLFLATLLLLSLFLPDAWILGNANFNDDDILYSILTIILIIFSLETIILSIVQDDYFLGFFFWMDTIGTISLILDIGWISNSFLPDNGARSKGSLLRAARAAKLGARYGRLMRLLKLMRFYKFLPCFDSNDEKIETEPEPTLSAVRKVSAALSSVLSRRVAALVLLIVIIVPFLSYDQVDYSPNAWAKSIRYSALNPNITESELTALVNDFRDFYHHKDISLMSVLLESPFYSSQRYTYSMPYPVRNDNIYHVEEDYYADQGGGEVKYRLRVKMNVTPIAQWNAFFGIILIILVIVVLIGFSASFQSSVDELVVIPLEKMMNTLRKSAASLLRGMKAMSREDEDQMNADQGGAGGDSSGSDLDEELETAVLEKMVEKCESLPTSSSLLSLTSCFLSLSLSLSLFPVSLSLFPVPLSLLSLSLSLQWLVS
jgi:hypothetical protein